MKRLVVLAGLILLSTLAQAQGADDSSTGAGITIIPRIDLSPDFTDGRYNEVTLGNTSLYTLFEGSISENLSFSVCNHWLTDWHEEGIQTLYKNTWHSDDVNWCDWANLTWSFGNFYLTGGKDMVTMGGFEFDQYDFDVHPFLCTSIWNNFSCYQWGGKIGYANDEETQGAALQVTSSPYGIHPFDEGLMTWSLQYRGSYGPLSLLYSTNLIGTAKGEYEWLVTLGHQLEAGDFTLGLDASNKVGDEYTILRDGICAYGTALYNPSDKWEFLVRGGIDKSTTDIKILEELGEESVSVKSTSYTFGGAVHCFPLKESRNLRLHAAAGYNTGMDMLTLTAGAIYYLSFPKK